MAAEHNAAVVRRAIEEIWNRGDLDVADALFSPDYVNHGGLVPDLVRGPEAIKVSVALYRTAFPDLHVAVENLVPSGDTVVLHWTACSSPEGELAGVTPTRKREKMVGVTRSRLVGRKIVESWTRWDMVDVLQE